MTDRVTLELLGLIFGGITALVIVIGAVVVRSHMDGRITLDAGGPVLPASLSSPR